MLNHERREYKLNGYPFREFEKIGINLNLLYNLSRKGLSEKEVLKRAFVYKYGKPIVDQQMQFVNYYIQHLIRVRKLNCNDRIEQLEDIRTDFFESGQLFGISSNKLSKIWDNITIKHYLN